MDSKETVKTLDTSRVDWMVTLVPFFSVMALAVYLFVFPDQANDAIMKVRFFFGDTCGVFYLIMGLGTLLISLYLAFSKFSLSCFLKIRRYRARRTG